MYGTLQPMQPYQLIDSGDLQRLEQWGQYILTRPDKMATWSRQQLPEWKNPDAIYHGTSVQDGTWEILTTLPETWPVALGVWKFVIGLSNSKHVGVFPEQLEQWLILDALIRKKQAGRQVPLRVLNLFAYTGAASIVAALAGAFVTHVDSSAPAIGRAKQNQALNGLDERSIRWIREDILTFVSREIRRKKTYDILILDPPAYGHGAQGEKFSLQNKFKLLLMEVEKLLSKEALAVFVTTYSSQMQAEDLRQQCLQVFENKMINVNPLVLKNRSTGIMLTTGSWAYIEL